ncbi:MAG TPA: ATP-binding protein [Candidatus Paceibacterota bacterium]
MNFERREQELYEEEFSWDNSLENSDRAQVLTEEKLKELGWPEDQAFAFSVAVKEAVDNAIVHGNLQLNRKDDAENYDKHITEAQEVNKDKHVKVWLRFSKEDATVQIKDEGAYVPDQLPDPTASEHLLEGSGRGLWMIFKNVDNVEFSPGEVILHKQRKDNEDELR